MLKSNTINSISIYPKKRAEALVMGSEVLDDRMESMSAGGFGNAMAPRIPKEIYITVSSVEDPHITELTLTLGFFSFNQAGTVTENA
jgi:hypothetical protein